MYLWINGYMAKCIFGYMYLWLHGYMATFIENKVLTLIYQWFLICLIETKKADCGNSRQTNGIEYYDMLLFGNNLSINLMYIYIHIIAFNPLQINI